MDSTNLLYSIEGCDEAHDDDVQDDEEEENDTTLANRGDHLVGHERPAKRCRPTPPRMIALVKPLYSSAPVAAVIYRTRIETSSSRVPLHEGKHAVSRSIQRLTERQHGTIYQQ